MSRSILNRSVISIAALAIGSVTLGAAPASAATPAGITRETVLSAAQSERDRESNDAARTLVERACGVGEDVGRDYEVRAAQDPDGVDGVLIQALVEGVGNAPSRYCTFAAFATTESNVTMTGTAVITGQDQEVVDFEATAVSPTYTLSGDVYVTEPTTDFEFGSYAVATASGDTVKTSATTTTRSRVVTPKTTQQKKASRKVYDRAVTKAKKSYAKALDKAGSSTSKKAAARKAFRASKTAAKAAYVARNRGVVSVVESTVVSGTSKTPFDLTTEDRRL